MIALLLLLAVLAGDAPPSTFSSPSGHWSLTVTRPDKKWNGVVELAMTHAGSEVWRGQHELGLREAVVSDEGRVAGYGYTGESPAESPPFPLPPDWPLGGVLHVFAVAPEGTRILDEVFERKGALYPDGRGNPWVRALFLHPELGRFVVRVFDEDVNRGAEEWWGYELATGKRLFRERPKMKLALEPSCRLLDARPVPGTPLVLVQWLRWDLPRCGAVFHLADSEWNAAWALALPHDYEKLTDLERKGLWDSSAILGVGPGRFELHLVAERKRVTFAVDHGPLIGSCPGPAGPPPEGWRVTEVGRQAADSGKKSGKKK